MTKKTLLLFGLTGVLFSSCIEHEVIPPPTPMVDLYAHFEGNINGTDVEWTENVNGYANISEKAKVILPPPSSSLAVYYSQMSSNQMIPSIKIAMGAIPWDASLSADPSLTQFNDFFLGYASPTDPAYSDGAMAGFEVTYRDAFGIEWTTSQTSVNPQSVSFTGITQESDETGDYTKFICSFDCWVYYTDPLSGDTDSLEITNAIYQGWFRR